jgi:hypothetical protein
MAEMLAASTSVEENLAAFRRFCLMLAEDKTWALLFLEFKLFAIRHPESKEKLQKYFDEAIPGNQEQEQRLVQLLGPAGHGKNALTRSVSVRTLQPVLSALAVETNFMPVLLDDQALRNVANRIFDALMQSPS